MWSFAFFSVIYQLSSTDLVTGLAFSPDCRIFYDVRGSCVNVWEPNSLALFSDTEEPFSDAASSYQSPSTALQISEAQVGEYVAVSALGAVANSSQYFFGNEEGFVELRDFHAEQEPKTIVFVGVMSVTHVCLSDLADHVSVVDLGGDIAIKNIVGDFGLPNPKLHLEGRGVHQIMFNHNSTFLLVISEDMAQIWDVVEAKRATCTILENGRSRRWLNIHQKKNASQALGKKTS